MTKRSSFRILHLVFDAGMAVIAAAFLGFLAYLYVAFNGPLTGDVRVELTPELLANLQAKRYELATAHLKTRQELPDVPSDLADPFDDAR